MDLLKRSSGRMNREIPGPSPSKSGKSRKNRESPKKDKKGRTSPDRETPFGSHLRTLALKTENFSKKSVVLVNAKMDLLKRSSPYFFRVLCPGGWVLVNPPLRFTKTTDSFTKIPGFKGKGS